MWRSQQMNQFGPVSRILVTGGRLYGIDGVTTTIYGVAWWSSWWRHHLWTYAIKQLVKLWWEMTAEEKENMKHLLHIAHFSSGNYLPREFTQFNIVFVLNLPATSHEAYYLLALKLKHRDQLHYPAEQQRRRECQEFSGPLRCLRLHQPTRSNIPTPFQRPLIKLLQRRLAYVMKHGIKTRLGHLPESMSVHNSGSRATPLAIAWTAIFNLRRALKRFNSSTVSFKCCLCNLSRS